jgi:hypothetical protein
MKYRFSRSLTIDYSALQPFVPFGEELTKAELLDCCSGEIPLELLQYVRELEFAFIGKDENGELYLT